MSSQNSVDKFVSKINAIARDAVAVSGYSVGWRSDDIYARDERSTRPQMGFCWLIIEKLLAPDVFVTVSVAAFSCGTS